VPEEQRPPRGVNYFIKKGVRDWYLNGRKYKYQTYNVCSAMAEEAIAKLLGLERLLTKSFFCRVRIDSGEELIGTMSSFAGGVDVRELIGSFQYSFTPELAKDLSCLNVIDAICYEKDHRPGNYHVILDDAGLSISVCCFDNDSPWSFSPFGKVSFKTYGGVSKIVKSRRINRPFLDSGLIDSIQYLSYEKLVKALTPFLGMGQIKACWRRIFALKKAISNTRFQFKEWNGAIMMEELQGQYGKTYYTLLYNLCEALRAGDK
jgi:hypothetical protein